MFTNLAILGAPPCSLKNTMFIASLHIFQTVKSPFSVGALENARYLNLLVVLHIFGHWAVDFSM